VKVVLGEEVAPAGSPVMVTVTEFAKPLFGRAVTVIGALVVVCATSRELVETESEKLGTGDGGAVDPPPPQPALRKRRTAVNRLIPSTRSTLTDASG
jgi:hypothetical protein